MPESSWTSHEAPFAPTNAADSATITTSRYRRFAALLSMAASAKAKPGIAGTRASSATRAQPAPSRRGERGRLHPRLLADQHRASPHFAGAVRQRRRREGAHLPPEVLEVFEVAAEILLRRPVECHGCR